MPESFDGLTRFQWDDANAEKSVQKNGVSRGEAEQVFFNRPLLVMPDDPHSKSERRYFVLGRTDLGRRLMIVFTIRGESVRVISSRPMSRGERSRYEQAQEN